VSPHGAGSESRTHKSFLLLYFKKEESSLSSEKAAPARRVAKDLYVAVAVLSGGV
jgi:hypothetical protein